MILWPHCLPLLVFQSTPPARGATYYCNRGPQIILYFNPRPPRGGRRFCFAIVIRLIKDFNPRPPRGGRRSDGGFLIAAAIFQSTPPARGATPHQAQYLNKNWISIHAPREGGDGELSDNVHFITISIHAPREGGDIARPAVKVSSWNFNPRPPRGGRPAVGVQPQ